MSDVIRPVRDRKRRVIRGIPCAQWAVWTAPSPRPTGHRTPACRACSISCWHCIHLPFFIIPPECFTHRNSVMAEFTLPSARSPTASSACPTAASERTAQPRGRLKPAEVGSGLSGWRLQAHRLALDPGVTLGRLPGLWNPDRTVALATAGHRTSALWPRSIVSRH